MALPMFEETDLDPALTLGERLAKSRKDAEHDQAYMAERITELTGVLVSRPLISKWERNKSIPNVEQAAAWAYVCSVPFGWLCGVPARSRCFGGMGLVSTPVGQMELAFGERPDLALV